MASTSHHPEVTSPCPSSQSLAPPPPPPPPQPTLSDLKHGTTTSPTLWYRIHVLLHDLCNVNHPASSKRLGKTADPHYIGKPYFTWDEAQRIKRTVGGPGGRTVEQLIEERVREKLERLHRKKRPVEGADELRVSAAHDLAPIIARLLQIDLKVLGKDEQFARLVGEYGLYPEGETWVGLKKRTFGSRKKRK
ncbi:hypothetical protein BO86DRAFT_441819 [Aspergillus japonicus CBS 114.51]|uniref:Uncharacterized protein n=1 Tax=Aspergillus japonicus CBS 114.51 TaxID=1448312 RepID=A0A8T8X9Q2_ASPJA|nr:hypothetical protein BO86DRAFT_441819 [Aspergillus japonicus CBS 114.51]RAH84811.1 hypothetical protein BO86DRAFT_441819 [Aspergillus japonicus CBS 114.51]